MLKRARDHMDDLVAALAVRTVYSDLDGTLLGPGGSLFARPGAPPHEAEALPTSEAATAVAALADAGIDLVLVSGRTREQAREVARVVGARAYIAEMGGLVVALDGGRDSIVSRPEGAWGRGTAQEAILRSGAAGFLLDAYPGSLEPHDPWGFLPRECSVLLRGMVDLPEARRVLAAGGYGWLDLLDNGLLARPPGRFPDLRDGPVHAYHLIPAGISKRSAVARDRATRNLKPAECLAIGDSVSDVDMAPEVGAMFLVANGEAALEGWQPDVDVYVTDRPHGLGFADAVTPFALRGGM